MNNLINIILVDDHILLRDGLKRIIEQNASFKIIGEASNGREVIKLCNNLNPHVIIMDVSMPDLNGIEATVQIIKQHPDIKIIGLSMYSSKQFIQEMFTAGAYGYLLKDGSSAELVTAIKTVLENKKYLSKNINQELLVNIKRGITINNKKLSTREKEVLQLLVEGKSSKEIADILFLSSKTVDVHRNNIMNKLNIHTLPELTKYAIKKGITSLE